MFLCMGTILKPAAGKIITWWSKVVTQDPPYATVFLFFILASCLVLYSPQSSFVQNRLMEQKLAPGYAHAGPFARPHYRKLFAAHVCRVAFKHQSNIKGFGLLGQHFLFFFHFCPLKFGFFEGVKKIVFKPTDYCLSASVSDASVHLSIYLSIYLCIYFSRSLNLRLERLSNKAIKQ